MRSRFAALVLLPFLLVASMAHAVELRLSAHALEHTLQQQLFNGPNGRYYVRGHDGSACYAYAYDPHVSFVGDRIVVHVKTDAKLGGSLMGSCVGLNVSPEVDLSMLPNAEGETIGFRDVRVDKLTEFHELNVFLLPFLSGKLPQQMRINAADLLRKMLSTARQTTGYDMSVSDLRIRSMQVIGDALVVDIDGALVVK